MDVTILLDQDCMENKHKCNDSLFRPIFLNCVVRNSISDLNRGIEIDVAVLIELIIAEMQFHNAWIALFLFEICTLESRSFIT